MNQFKIRQALESLAETLHEKEQLLKEKHTPEEKSLDDEQRLKLLKAGKIKLKPGLNGIGYYDDFHKIFDCSEYEVSSKLNRTAFDKEFAKVEKRATKIKNQIVFGADEEKTLKLLNEFAES